MPIESHQHSARPTRALAQYGCRGAARLDDAGFLPQAISSYPRSRPAVRPIVKASGAGSAIGGRERSVQALRACRRPVHRETCAATDSVPSPPGAQLDIDRLAGAVVPSHPPRIGRTTGRGEVGIIDMSPILQPKRGRFAKWAPKATTMLERSAGPRLPQDAFLGVPRC